MKLMNQLKKNFTIEYFLNTKLLKNYRYHSEEFTTSIQDTYLMRKTLKNTIDFLDIGKNEK